MKIKNHICVSSYNKITKSLQLRNDVRIIKHITICPDMWSRDDL